MIMVMEQSTQRLQNVHSIFRFMCTHADSHNAGPRQAGIGCEDAEQGVLKAVTTPTGQVKMRVHALVLGYFSAVAHVCTQTHDDMHSAYLARQHVHLSALMGAGA